VWANGLNKFYYLTEEITMKKVILCLMALATLAVGGLAVAATCATTSGIALVACRVVNNLSGIGTLLLGTSYIAGMAFGIGAIVKFKAHKENPTQVPLSQGIVLLFVGAALIGIPSVYKLTTKTLFASGYTTAPVSGMPF
jgi:intracellular multiplication protein IcmD